jgi:DNA repair protein RecO
MFIKYHTKGIIVSGKVESVDSRRVNIFTEDFGLINAKVQGGRNSSSKLRSGTQDFSFGEFSLVHGKTGWRVVSTRAEGNFFETLRYYPDRLKIVSNILNLVRKLIAEEKVHNPIFDTIINFFCFLTETQNKDIALAECLTLMRILYLLGYMASNPEMSMLISSSEISARDLSYLAPRRQEIVHLINESLKTT